MSDKLRIFVSGNESELDDERAIAIKVIKSLGFEPVGSENRPASSDPIESEYLGEVETSDFYIGIFGKEDSDGTRKEFEKARSIGKCTLVFQKNVDSSERKPELGEFLNKIKDSKSGVVYLKYNNSADLETAIVNSLSYYITKKFRELIKLQNVENKRENEDMFRLLEEHQTDIQLYEKMKKFPFLFRFSKNFGKKAIVEFKIISTLKKGERHMVDAKIKGSTENGFLDLAIKDPEGLWLWFPDPHSYDSPSDTGNLSGENGRYESQWEFSIPDKSGKYLFLMGLYENNFANREIVNYDIQEITIE